MLTHSARYLLRDLLWGDSFARRTLQKHLWNTCSDGLHALIVWFVLIQAGTSHATNWSSPGNMTSGVRPVVLLGTETRGSTLEQQWCSPITDVLLHRSTGSAPDTRPIWQMLRRKVRGQRESRHTHLTLPPYRPAAPSSTQKKILFRDRRQKKYSKNFSLFFLVDKRYSSFTFYLTFLMKEKTEDTPRGSDGNPMYVLVKKNNKEETSLVIIINSHEIWWDGSSLNKPDHIKTILFILMPCDFYFVSYKVVNCGRACGCAEWI